MLFRRAPLALALTLLAAACTTPSRTDTASLPPVTTTTSTTTTTLPLPTTTSTIAPQSGPDVIAWLTAEAATQTLLEAVAGWEGVGSIALVTSQQAYDEFAALFADRPEVVDGVLPETLPQSLRIELSHPSFAAAVAARLRSLSDIDEVVTAVTPVCNAFPDWNIVIFVADDLELTRLRNELAATDGISDIAVIGREAAFAEFVARFGGEPNLSAGIGVRDMSVSLRARTTNPVTLSLIGGRFVGDPAVKGVQVFTPAAPDCR